MTARQKGLPIEQLELLWRQVQKPGRYIGGESNQIKKDPQSAKIKIALAFPEVYELGLSYLGQKILYFLLNQSPDILAERVYAPWPDFELQLRKHQLPLYSLENKIPLNNFEIVGFSLLYELNDTNLLNMLELGQIPRKTADRQLSDPLVIAGGPAAFNPEPLADFIDFFVFGDGEEVFFEIIKRYLEVRPEASSREELLRSFLKIKGVYVPYFYQAERQEKSFLLVPRPEAGLPETIDKRLICPLDKISSAEKAAVPNIQSVFDRWQVEVARGCPQNCRFCQAASLYFPYRYRSGQEVEHLAYTGLKKTGYEELSFIALSVGDYPYLEQSIKDLLPFLESRKISISLPSLRPETLSSELVEDIVRIKKTGFTLVPEAGSERLRRVINKRITDEQLTVAAGYAFAHGWRLLKLYFMIGLPTERQEDLEAIVDLLSRLIESGKRVIKNVPAINLTLSSFIPKPHTPFQWLAMEEAASLQEKQYYLRSRLRRWKKIEIKESKVESSILEAVFSRGDRKLGRVLEEAFRLGARFDGWTDQFNFNLWQQAFDHCQIDYQNYLQAIDPEAILPWEIVKTGLKKTHLWQEYLASLEARQTPVCQEKTCSDCQACYWPQFKPAGPTISTIEADSWPAINLKSNGDKENKRIQPVYRYRATYSKTGLVRFISHNDLLNQIDRSFRKAEIEISFSQGFHPKMLITHGPALPLGMEAKAEVLEFKSPEILSSSEFINKIQAGTPEGLSFIGLKACSAETRPLFQDIKGLVYSLNLGDPVIRAAGLAPEKLTEGYLFDYSSRFEGQVKIELESLQDRLFFYLAFNPQKPLRIQDIVEAWLGIENPVYALTREYLIFSQGTDSRQI
ncbi:MAG: TIGR03960 family B12-binding radical SAM protein [Candidatus Saccharicenans sp.]|nr:TIGR03960 family B12-binding radical SAM protein [Candidatus Saccharicenans sp.]